MFYFRLQAMTYMLSARHRLLTVYYFHDSRTGSVEHAFKEKAAALAGETADSNRAKEPTMENANSHVGWNGHSAVGCVRILFRHR